MANKHRRHSSVDTLGLMYTNRVDEAPAKMNRSSSTRNSSFRIGSFRIGGFRNETTVPALKRQTSLRFHPGEYFTGCFGPRADVLRRNGGLSSQNLVETDSNAVAMGRQRPPRARGHARALSAASIFSNFNFGSMRFGGRSNEELAARAVELNQKAATHPHRVALQQPVGRWVMEDDEEYYLKPPAWKQALRRLRAEAKRHVHPTPRLDYDAASYAKNFDNGGRVATIVNEDDEFEVKARVLHTKLLTRLHSNRFDHIPSGQDSPPSKLLKSVSVPSVNLPKPKDEPLWERRAARPLQKLELTRSL